MSPRFGFTDELRVVFISRGVTWGALGLYRGVGDPPFTTADADHFTGATTIIGAAISRSHFQTASGTSRTPGQRTATAVGGEQQAVLIIGASQAVTHLTASADAAVEELGGWDHGSLPANILAVVAAARNTGNHTETMVHAPTGRWLTVRAAPLTGPAGNADVVVTITVTPRTALTRLALAAYGLTNREEDVALLVMQGASTQSIAEALHLSPHTVQDHLKKIFDKTGSTSRRHLTAQLTLE